MAQAKWSGRIIDVHDSAPYVDDEDSSVTVTLQLDTWHSDAEGAPPPPLPRANERYGLTPEDTPPEREA